MARRTVVWWSLALATFAGPAATAGDRSPPAWSPDGEWICYAIEGADSPPPPATAWIFDPPGAEPRAGTASPAVAARRSRLWATKVGSDSDPVLLDDSPGPISPPCWRPDGKALAFGRVVPGEAGKARFELVVIEGAGRRVLFSRAVGVRARDDLSDLAWSPDGRFLAVPRPGAGGLAILLAESGAVVKAIDAASSPAWSPIGGRLFHVAREAGRDRLECLDGHLGASRRLAEFGRVVGPLLVDRDGRSVVLLASGPSGLLLGAPSDRVELARIHVEDGRVERVSPALAGPIGLDRGPESASLTQDRDGENLFGVMVVPSRPCQVTWLKMRERAVFKNFPVLDPMVPAGDLALSPRGGVLALRLGGPGASGLPILCDLDSMRLTPLAPDAATRRAWLALVLGTARSILRDACPRPILGGRALDRPVAPPIPGELEANSEAMIRLRRLGRFGRAFADPPDEARFLLDYLREDYPAALADIDRLEAVAPTADRRLKLLGLRAQSLAGMGDLDRARDAFAYLKRIEPTRSHRLVESTSRGFVTSGATTTDAGWADYALRRIDLLAREDSDDPIDHHNPDAPVPGLGLDIEPPAPPVFGPPPPPVIAPAPPPGVPVFRRPPGPRF